MRAELRSNFNLARSSLDLARSVVLLAFFLCSGSNFVKVSASKPILFSLSLRFITFDLINPIERKEKLASVAKRRLTGPARTIKLEVAVGLRNSEGSFFRSSRESLSELIFSSVAFFLDARPRVFSHRCRVGLSVDFRRFQRIDRPSSTVTPLITCDTVQREKTIIEDAVGIIFRHSA